MTCLFMQAHLSEREYWALQKAKKVSFDVEQDRRQQMADARSKQGNLYFAPRARQAHTSLAACSYSNADQGGTYVPRRIGRERIGRLSLGRLATVGTDGCKEAVTSSKCNSRFARSKAASNLVFLDILSAQARSANSPTFIAILRLWVGDHPPQRADASLLEEAIHFVPLQQRSLR